MRHSAILLFVSVLILSGCGLMNADDPVAVEQDFGVSVRSMIENQKVVPPSAESRSEADELTTGDGEAAVSSIRRLGSQTQ